MTPAEAAILTNNPEVADLIQSASEQQDQESPLSVAEEENCSTEMSSQTTEQDDISSPDNDIVETLDAATQTCNLTEETSNKRSNKKEDSKVDVRQTKKKNKKQRKSHRATKTVVEKPPAPAVALSRPKTAAASMSICRTRLIQDEVRMFNFVREASTVLCESRWQLPTKRVFYWKLELRNICCGRSVATDSVGLLVSSSAGDVVLSAFKTSVRI